MTTNHKGSRKNRFRSDLRELNLLGNKHIPKQYLVNSRNVRLEVLAGLIDTDGYIHNGSCEIAQKSKKLSDDIVRLARSLGFRALISSKLVDGEIYHRISLSGDLSIVPTRIARKQSPKRKQKKNVLRTGFSLTSIGIGDYYGFTIDGNRRFLLGDFTVAHNTVVFCLLALEFLKQGEGVLILAHRKELIDQAHEKIEAISGLPAGKIQAGKAINWDYDVQVASVQTLTRRKVSPEAGLVIVDECHHASAQSYTRVMEAYPNAYILGVSATPCRTDGQSLKRHFDHLITGPTVGDLIQQNYLSKYKLYAAQSKINTTGVKTKRGDYDQAQLAQAVDDSIVCGDIVETWQKYANGTQTLVFTVDVEHSKNTATAFNEAGISAAHIDGKTPKGERDRVIQAFKDKEIKVLSNCAIFTEGFDCPGIETVQMVRPTKSLILWLQMIGRGLRVIEGKDFARIIDHTDNWSKLGLPDDEFEWSLEPKSLKKGAAFAQECPSCHHVFRPLPHEIKEPHRRVTGADGKLADLYKLQCPSCLESFEVQFGEGDGGGGEPKILTKDESAQVEEINLDTQDWAIAQFEKLKVDQEATGKKQGWIYFRLIESDHAPHFTLGDWRYFAKRLGYKQGWAFHKFREAQSLAIEQGGEL